MDFRILPLIQREPDLRWDSQSAKDEKCNSKELWNIAQRSPLHKHLPRATLNIFTVFELYRLGWLVLDLNHLTVLDREHNFIRLARCRGLWKMAKEELGDRGEGKNALIWPPNCARYTGRFRRTFLTATPGGKFLAWQRCHNKDAPPAQR